MRAAPAMALLVLLAGCVTSPPAEPVLGPQNASERTPVEAPREIAAFKETNKTEEGIGGVDHAHDYWLGRDRVDVFHDWVYLEPFPIFEESGRVRSVSRQTQLPRPNLVYEGTATLEFLVGATSVTWTDPYPAPAMRLEYRTAADGAQEWRDGGALVPGTPTVVAVEPDQTDMPHSTASLWVFRILADGAHSFYVNLTVTAVRGTDVPPWPGHPDFYADKDVRVVFDGDASNREIGLAARYYLYGGDRDWRFPDKVISWGTGHLEVFVNVTRLDGPPFPPHEAYLRVRNATQIYDDLTVHYDVHGNNDFKSYHFKIPVDTDGMDSPYAPSSRWAFSFAVSYAMPGWGGVTPYAVDYHLTVLAVKADDPDAAKSDV